MGAQTCKCDCVNDKKEIAGAGQAVTAATGFEEDVVIKPATMSKTAITAPYASSRAVDTTSKAPVDDTRPLEQSSVDDDRFAPEDEPLQHCFVPPPPRPITPEPPSQKTAEPANNEMLDKGAVTRSAPPEPCSQEAPIMAKVEEPEDKQMPDEAISETINKSPIPLDPTSHEAPVEAKVEQPNDKKMLDKEIPGTIKLVFHLEAGKALEATFAEFDEQSGQGGLVVTSITEASALMRTKDNSCGICVGDAILQVQEQAGGSGEILRGLRDAKLKGGTLELVVRPRPDTFELTLQRTGSEKMGINVALRDEMSDKIEIQQVSDEGAVQTWNVKNPTRLVVKGDVIGAVNNVSNDASDMIQDMQECWLKKKQLVLQIASCSSKAQRDSNKISSR